jgi:hypothetical protein
VQLRADQTVPYGKVVALMGIANKAGLSRIGFVTEAESAQRETALTPSCFAPSPPGGRLGWGQDGL